VSGITRTIKTQPAASTRAHVVYMRRITRATLSDDRRTRSSVTYAEHWAYSKSNIPAIIQHAEQTRRHDAIRPRSKGAREERIKRAWAERERGRERVRTRGLPLWINSYLINKKEKDHPHTKKSLGPICLELSALQDAARAGSGSPARATSFRLLNWHRTERLWFEKRGSVYSWGEEWWKDTWRKRS